MPIVKERARLSGERRMLPVGIRPTHRHGDQAIRWTPAGNRGRRCANGKSSPKFSSIHLTHRRGISVFEAATLVPIGINRRLVARCIEFGKLSRGQVPANGTQILA